MEDVWKKLSDLSPDVWVTWLSAQIGLEMEELDVDLSFILGTYILPSPSAEGRLSESRRANRNPLRVQTLFCFFTRLPLGVQPQDPFIHLMASRES